jgi:hypothetical protein
LNVSTTQYDLKGKKATLTLTYLLTYGGYVVSRQRTVVVSLQPNLLEETEKKIASENNRLTDELEKIKMPIRALLKISKRVEVDLEAIIDELLSKLSTSPSFIFNP